MKLYSRMASVREAKEPKFKLGDKVKVKNSEYVGRIVRVNEVDPAMDEPQTYFVAIVNADQHTKAEYDEKQLEAFDWDDKTYEVKMGNPDILVKEDFRIPGTKIMLEKGDRIIVIPKK